MCVDVCGGEGCVQYMSLTFTLLLRDVHILSEKKQDAENFVYYTIFYLRRGK